MQVVVKTGEDHSSILAPQNRCPLMVSEAPHSLLLTGPFNTQYPALLFPGAHGDGDGGTPATQAS